MSVLRCRFCPEANLDPQQVCTSNRTEIDDLLAEPEIPSHPCRFDPYTSPPNF